MDNQVYQNKNVPKNVRGTLPYLYSKNLAFAPINFYDSFEKNVLKKFENGKFYRKNESALLPFFIFKSLGLKSKISDRAKGKIIKILQSDLSDTQLLLLAKGYFYHAFSRLEQYDRDIVSIAQERIKENQSTSFLSQYFTPESLQRNFTYNKLHFFSTDLKNLGRGLICEGSLFAKALWDIYVYNIGPTVDYFIKNFKISELTAFLEDLLCSDKRRIKFRENEEETNKVLAIARHYLLENNTLLSNKDIAYLTDFFFSIGEKSFFEKGDKFTNLLEKRSSKAICVSESIDFLYDRLIKFLSEKNQQRFFFFLKKITQLENFEVSFCVKEKRNFKYLERNPFATKLFPIVDNCEEQLIIVYRSTHGYLAIFPQSQIIRYKRSSPIGVTTLSSDFFADFLIVEIGNYPWDKQIEKYFETVLSESFFSTALYRTGKVAEHYWKKIFG